MYTVLSVHLCMHFIIEKKKIDDKISFKPTMQLMESLYFGEKNSKEKETYTIYTANPVFI